MSIYFKNNNILENHIHKKNITNIVVNLNSLIGVKFFLPSKINLRSIILTIIIDKTCNIVPNTVHKNFL